MIRRATLLGCLGLAACTGSDASPPTLDVLTPSRGTVSDTAQVQVTGTVDDPGATVSVNGQPAQVADDGSWAANVTVEPGIATLETIASNGDAEAHDVRAVMSGDLRPTDGYVEDAVGAKVGSSAFNVISALATDQVKALDLTTMAQPMNPVYSTGGSCLGVDLDVTYAAINDFNLSLSPAPGQLDLDAHISGLEIDLYAPFHLACIGGSDDVVIWADDVYLSGGLGLSADGAIHASVSNVHVSVNGLYLDVGGLPDSIVNLFDDYIQDIIAQTAETMIQEKVPGMVEQSLTELSGKQWNTNVLDRNVGLGVTPKAIVLDYDGAFVGLDTTMHVFGGEQGVYVSNPNPLTPSLLPTDGVGVAVSDDAINQLFAGMWASGALSMDIPVDRSSPISLVVGGDTAVMKVKMLLPPVVSMDETGDLRMSIGDLILEAQDASGSDIMTFAVSLSTTMGAEATEDNHIKLHVGDPTVKAQVTQQIDRPTPMSDHDLQNLIETVFPMVTPMVNNAMASMPLPSVMGVSLESPSLESHGGYVVLQTGVAY